MHLHNGKMQNQYRKAASKNKNWSLTITVATIMLFTCSVGVTWGNHLNNVSGSSYCESASISEAQTVNVGLGIPAGVSAPNIQLINDFSSYYSRAHASVYSANIHKFSLFLNFLNNSPADARVMNTITMEQEQSFALRTPVNTSLDNYVVEHGNYSVTKIERFTSNGQNLTVIFATYSLVLKGETYKVSAAITEYPNGTKVIDPYDSVAIDYLSIWFFGWHRYGEVDYIYQDYYYNTVSFTGYSYNEAYAWDTEWQSFEIAFLANMVIEAIWPLFLASIAGTIAWVYTAFWDALDITAAANVINSAYSADTGTGFIPTAIQNDYIWDSYVGIVTGNVWGLHVYNDNQGWINALLPEAFSGYDSVSISSQAHTFQNDYGSQWVWVGPYYS